MVERFRLSRRAELGRQGLQNKPGVECGPHEEPESESAFDREERGGSGRSRAANAAVGSGTSGFMFSRGIMDRVRFITHQGKQVLLIDSTNSTLEEGMRVADEARLVISVQPPQSTLILIDLTGAKISRESVMHAKEVTVLDRPYVKRAALVGAESLPNAFYEAIKRFSQREFPRFNTREQALDWLVGEERVTTI